MSEIEERLEEARKEEKLAEIQKVQELQKVQKVQEITPEEKEKRRAEVFPPLRLLYVQEVLTRFV